MSDGVLNFPKRLTHPDTPSVDRVKIYVFNNEPYYKLDNGLEYTFKGDQGDQGLQGPQGVQGPIGLTGPQGPMKVEGLVSETSVVTLPDSSLFSLVYRNPITVTASGNLYVDISLAVAAHSNGNDMIFQVDFDGTYLGVELREEFKETSSNQSNWRSQTIDIGFKNAGVYNLDLYFAKEFTGRVALLKNYTAKVIRY